MDNKMLFKKGSTRFYYVERPSGSGHFQLVAKNVKLYSHDFSGDRSKFKTRSICLDIPEEVKDRLLEDGWDLRISEPKDDRYEPKCFLPITIRFNEYGPEIMKTGPNTPVKYDQDTVGVLDRTSMTDIELVINPFHNPNNPDARPKAYLSEMRFKLNMSPLDYEFNDDEDEDDLPFN